MGVADKIGGCQSGDRALLVAVGLSEPEVKGRAKIAHADRSGMSDWSAFDATRSRLTGLQQSLIEASAAGMNSGAMKLTPLSRSCSRVSSPFER